MLYRPDPFSKRCMKNAFNHNYCSSKPITLLYSRSAYLQINGGERREKNNETDRHNIISRSKQQHRAILVRFFEEPAERRGETGILKSSKKQTYNNVFSPTYQYEHHANLQKSTSNCLLSGSRCYTAVVQ